jgi:hypothetical protein
MNKYDRTRFYENQDLWEFYYHYKKRNFDLENITRDFQMKAVAVSNGSYISSYQGNIKEIYKYLIDAAKTELSQNKVPSNTDLYIDGNNASKAKGEFETALFGYIEQIKNSLGPNFSTSTLSSIKPSFRGGNKTAFANHVAKTLFAGSAQSSGVGSRFKSLLSLNGSKYFGNLVEQIKGSKSQQTTSLGFLGEELIEAVGQEIALNGINGIKNAISKVVNTAAKSVAATYVNSEGQVVGAYQTSKKNVKKVTSTPDIRVSYTSQQNNPFNLSTDINISLKLGQDLEKIKYKGFSAAAGEPFTRIAHWSHLTKTMIAWTSYNGLLYSKYDLDKYIAATFASLAVGGFKEDRASMLLGFSGSKIHLESLDVVLKRLTDRLTIRGFSIRNQKTYIDNARKIAGLKDGIYPDQLKYAELKDLNFNFNIETLGL